MIILFSLSCRPDWWRGRASVLLLPFTLAHIRIYSKSRFSIKTPLSNPLSCLMGQKKSGLWLSPVNCGEFPLRLSVTAFENGAHQIRLLSWVSMGLIPSRIDFSIQLRWTALGFLCWVLMWVPPQSLVLPGVVGIGTDGTHVFPILLLWLNGWLTIHPSLTFPFKKVFLFFWVHWVPLVRKSCPARDCGGTHDGTDLALTLLWVLGQLIYGIETDVLVFTLTQTGSHSDLFGK